MRYPDVMPGVLETEVVRYEEKDYKRLIKSRFEALKNDSENSDNESNVGNSSVTVPYTTLPPNFTVPANTIQPFDDPNGNKKNLWYVFYNSDFSIEGLQPSTTYYMKFRWKTSAGSGPFTPYYKIRINRFIDFKKILIGCGVASFFVIVAIGFCLYVKRRWPGLVKVVIAKVRDHVRPSYMNPPDVFNDFNNQDDDDNIVYEFEGPAGEAFSMT